MYNLSFTKASLEKLFQCVENNFSTAWKKPWKLQFQKIGYHKAKIIRVHSTITYPSLIKICQKLEEFYWKLLTMQKKAEVYYSLSISPNYHNFFILHIFYSDFSKNDKEPNESRKKWLCFHLLAVSIKLQTFSFFLQNDHFWLSTSFPTPVPNINQNSKHGRLPFLTYINNSTSRRQTPASITAWILSLGPSERYDNAQQVSAKTSGSW